MRTACGAMDAPVLRMPDNDLGFHGPASLGSCEFLHSAALANALAATTALLVFTCGLTFELSGPRRVGPWPAKRMMT